MPSIFVKSSIFFSLFLFFSNFSHADTCDNKYVITVKNDSDVTIYLKLSDEGEELSGNDYTEGKRGNLLLSPGITGYYCTEYELIKFS